MFSLDVFYKVIHNNLFSPLSLARSLHFQPFGTYDIIRRLHQDIDKFSDISYQISELNCYFLDQEPWYDYTMSHVEKTMEFILNSKVIFANSEKSEFKDSYIKSTGGYDWYYFFHGFLALDWYSDFKYLAPSAFKRFDKVFICYNHLISGYRSYRLHLGSNLIQNDLVKHGYVSLPLADSTSNWQDTLRDPNSPLSTKAKIQIHRVLSHVNEPLHINGTIPTGNLSADVSISELTSAFWHIVTETVYFLPKLHLTEKVFKPIVAKRPFILVAAPGNLEYIKSYGFKTFDRWIDESYDQELDNYIRIEKITNEIKKLCALSPDELDKMYSEMEEVLEYNFQHFYSTFKDSIVDELVNNFASIIDTINSKRGAGHFQFEYPAGYLEEVKTRLKQ